MTEILPSGNHVSFGNRNFIISAEGASADILAKALSFVVLFVGLAIMINILNK